jgi:hypothetical protein
MKHLLCMWVACIYGPGMGNFCPSLQIWNWNNMIMKYYFYHKSWCPIIKILIQKAVMVFFSEKMKT